MKINLETIRPFLLAIALGCTFGTITGCEQEPFEDTADDIGDAIEDAGDAIGDAAEDAADEIEDAADEIEDRVD